MSGSRNDLTRRSARTDAEWARDVSARLRSLELPGETVRIGRWVLSVDSSGELVATTQGRTVRLTEPLQGNQAAATAGLHRTFTVTVEGSPTGGVFTLLFVGAETVELARNATAAAIKTALVGLSPRYSELDFSTSGAAGGPWTVIVPDLGNLGLGRVELTGGTDPAITIERT